MFRSRVLARSILHQCESKSKYIRPTPTVIGIQHACMRQESTVAVDDSYVKKFMKAVGWMDPSRTRLKLTGYFLYECVPQKVAYDEWFKKLDLPDTFASWFMVTELHVWMLMVRYMAEDIQVSSLDKKKYVKGDGHFVRNCMIEALWADVGNRVKLLEGANPAVTRKQVTELSEMFQAALVAYDEGLSDDRILASAVWRRFFSNSYDIKAEHVQTVVHFIRHQISVLDKISSEKLRFKPEIPWLSILDH